MTIVLDSSIAASWCFKDEHFEIANRVQDKLAEASAVVSTLFWHEMRSILVINERRSRIAPPDSDRFLDNLSLFAITTDNRADSKTIMLLARHHRLTGYDASYLELALRLRLPLATLDTQLHIAARDSGVTIFS